MVRLGDAGADTSYSGMTDWFTRVDRGFGRVGRPVTQLFVKRGGCVELVGVSFRQIDGPPFSRPSR